MANIKSPLGGVSGVRSPGIVMTAVELRPSGQGGSPALSVSERDAPAFNKQLQSDPAAALAALGIAVSPEEARRVSQQVRELSAAPGASGQMKNIKINGEVTATVKMTIGK